MLVENIIFYLFIFILGTVMGSFVGAMTWRMHEGKDWVNGRSECERCHHKLGAIDLIPIVSYLLLKGKCRYCGKKISATALRLEAGTGLAFLVSALLFPSMVAEKWVSPLASSVLTAKPWTIALFLVWLFALVVMMALYTYDKQWHILPDGLVWTLLGASIVYSLIYCLEIKSIGRTGWVEQVVPALAPLFGIYLIVFVLSQGKWIGFGDVKLCFALGFFLTWWQGLLVLFLANLLGSLSAVPKLRKHQVKMNTQIAFGPCLILATYIVALIGWTFRGLFVLV